MAGDVLRTTVLASGCLGGGVRVAGLVAPRPVESRFHAAVSGRAGAIWVHGVYAIPWAAIILVAQLRSTPQDDEDAALLDAGPLTVFTRLTLSQVAGPAALAAVLILVTVATEITVTDLYQVRTYAEELYVGFAINTNLADSIVPADTSVKTALAMVTAFVLLAFGSCIMLVPKTPFVSDAELREIGLRKWRWPALVGVAVLTVVFVAVPLANFLTKAGIVVENVDGVRQRSWSAAKLLDLVWRAPNSYREEFGWSLAIGQTASAIAVATGLPWAWFARNHRILAVLMLLVAAVCLAVPGPLLGLLVIKLFSGNSEWLQFAYSNTIAAPTLCQVVKVIPLTWILLWISFRSIPQATVDTATIAGASPLRQLFAIAIPERWPAWFAFGFAVSSSV